MRSELTRGRDASPRWRLALAAVSVLRAGLTFGFAFGFASPSFVRAQSDDDRARMHFEAGRSYYDQARYDDAVREFEQSYALSQRPELLLNMSQAQERALRFDDAIASARRYLEVIPDASDRLTVEDRIANLQALKARFQQGVPQPNPAPGSLAAPAPASGSQTPEPAAQPPQLGRIDRTADLAAPVPQVGDAARADEREGASPLILPSIVLMSVGGAALVASLVTGLVAHADYDSLERQCDSQGHCPPEARDELDDGETLATTSTVLTVIGVLAAGAGGALLYVGSRQASEPERSQLSLGLGPTPLSLQGTLKF